MYMCLASYELQSKLWFSLWLIFAEVNFSCYYNEPFNFTFIELSMVVYNHIRSLIGVKRWITFPCWDILFEWASFPPKTREYTMYKLSCFGIALLLTAYYTSCNKSEDQVKSCALSFARFKQSNYHVLICSGIAKTTRPCLLHKILRHRLIRVHYDLLILS